MKRLALLASAAVAVLAPTDASAAITIFTANLTGSQEVPPVTTTGSGSATVTVDDVLNTMRVQINFANLTGTTSAAHIHCCSPPGANAPVATPVPSFPGFPTGVTAGAYDQTFNLTLTSSFNPAFVTANGGTATGARSALLSGMFSGLSYVNVHTSRFPGGEIRGQLAAVPEPGTWAMMLIGFGAAGWSLRLQRRKRTALA